MGSILGGMVLVYGGWVPSAKKEGDRVEGGIGLEEGGYRPQAEPMPLRGDG